MIVDKLSMGAGAIVGAVLIFAPPISSVTTTPSRRRPPSRSKLGARSPREEPDQ
jgi:hypothetical protein